MAALTVPAIASAGVLPGGGNDVGSVPGPSYSQNFDSFNTGSVEGQPIADTGVWSAGYSEILDASDPSGFAPYDQSIVDNGGGKSLRVSNAVADGAFEQQVHAPTLASGASEAAGGDQVFHASFTVQSPQYQQGLAVSASPDDGHGSRMGYIRFEDQSDGIHAFIVDNPVDANQRQTDAGVALAYGVPHTITISMKLVPGQTADNKANDIVRYTIDGTDIGDKTHTCFTSWEQWYRYGESREPTTFSVDSLTFMARGTSVPSVLGGGYLFDDVHYDASNTNPPADNTQCGPKGAFCSPGFWKNAKPAAWSLIGTSPSARFNDVVVPGAYANAISPPNTTLADVLNAKGANTFGKAAGPFGLNPFNAVGAALTNRLPGYTFGGVDAPCPISNAGVLTPAS
jgi:hypothetical protein